MAQTLLEIKQLLVAHGLRPKKKHGQNFLHDGNHMNRVLDAANLAPGDRVLEVGPGTGALSERLIEAGAHVVAVEIDPDLEPILNQRLGGHERFTLIIGDVLDGKHRLNPVVIEALNSPRPHRGRAGTGVETQSTSQLDADAPPCKLIANLPYHIASPLLVNLALDHPAMTDAVVMVQKEVADRLAAGPSSAGGGKAYGPLGIILQAVFEVRRVSVLSPGCFYPQPSIASAVVGLTRRDEPICDDPRAFAAFVHKLFGKRRKQLGAILGRGTPLPPDVSPEARPETLGVEQLAALARWIDRSRPPA